MLLSNTKWPIVKLEEVCEILDNLRKPVTAKDRKKGPYPYYGANGVQDYVDDYIFDEELVLLAEDGGQFDDPRKGVAYRVSGKCWVNNHAHVLRPKANIHVDYLGHVLRQYDVRPFITGAVVKKLNQKSARSLPIPLPPLEDQKHIVSILDQADSLRKKRKEAMSLLDDYVQSVFLDMFGDPSTDNKFGVIRIEDIVSKEKNSIKAGPFGSSLKKECYVQSGYKIYGQEQVIKDDFEYGDYYIDEAKFNELKNCSIKSGDILISLVGSFGKISIVPDIFEPGIINPRLMKVSVDKSRFEPLYVKKALQSKSVQNQIMNLSHGGTMGIVNVGIMKQIQIVNAPLELQKEFIEVISKISDLKESMSTQRNIVDDQFNALMQKAFIGELVA